VHSPPPGEGLEEHIHSSHRGNVGCGGEAGRAKLILTYLSNEGNCSKCKD